MKKLGIIPARGGSKRIPRKNCKNFLGKPIIAYSIEAALKSNLFDEVMVSTDDEEIATIAKEYGATVPFLRSAETANDMATTMDVLNEVIEQYGRRGVVFDYVCCIYATAPLIRTEDLVKGFELLLSKGYISVFPVVAFSYPIWRGLQQDEQGKIGMVWPEYLNSRSQDLPQVYHDAGQWYWYKPEKAKQSLFTENSGSIVLDESLVQDIDTETDWILAEMKYNLIKN